MSYVGFGGTPEVAQFNAAVKRAAEGGGREERLKAAAIAMGTRALDDAVTKFRQTDAGKVIYNSGQAVTNLHSAIKQIKDGKMDAAGIANVAASSFAMMNNVAAIVGMGSPRAAAEITKWGRTGVNCAVGMSVPVWGPLSCGLQVLSNFLDYITGAEYREDWGTPRTLFRPHELSVPLIVADASRLADVLKYYYGVNDYHSLYNRLVGVDEFKWLVGADDAGGYPIRPMMTGAGKIVASDNRALPGHNLRTILQMMTIGKAANHAHYAARDGLAAVAGWRHGLEPSGRGLYRRYEWDHDVNHHAIATAAYWGRMAAAASGDQRVTVIVTPVGDVVGWPGIRPRVKTYQPPTIRMIDTRPFIIVDELINFFGAVTRREIDVGGTTAAYALVKEYGIGQHNPTQHLYVKLGDRRGEPDAVGKIYSKTCWTNLGRSTEQACDLQNRVGPGVGGDILRDVGTIRLMAAFSFLHQSYLWSHPVRVEREQLDPIRKIKLTGTIADELEAPVDPRGVLGVALHPAEQALTGGNRAHALSRAATSVRAYRDGTMAFSRTWNPNLGYGRGALTGEWLAEKIKREQALLKQALTQAQAVIQPERLEQARQDAVRQAEQAWVQARGGLPLTSNQIAEIRRRVYGIEVGPTTEIPRDAYQHIQRVIEQRASTLLLADPMRRLDLRLEKKPIGTGGIVLLGAAALLALKFLK